MKPKVFGAAFCFALCALWANAGGGAVGDAWLSRANPYSPPLSLAEASGKITKIETEEAATSLNFKDKMQALNGSEPKEFEFASMESPELKVRGAKGIVSAGKQAAAVKRSRPAKAVSVSDGAYVSKDLSYYDGEINKVVNLFQEDGEWKLSGIYGQSDTVTVAIDAATGSLSIEPQAIAYNETYESDVVIYPVEFRDGGKIAYFTDKPITGTIDENGAISLGAWGVFVAEGEMEGGVFNAFTSSSWIPSNATITGVDEKGETVSYPSLVEQPYDNELKIYNFVGNGVAVSASITSAKQVKVSPQFIMSNMIYGDFYCYPADLSTQVVDTKSPIIGKGTESTMEFGGWVVAARRMATVVAMIRQNTTITTTLKIDYPEPVKVAFDGLGTEASPYLLTTAKDLEMLSQAVADGENYEGVYFRQDADIDMGSLTSRFTPIGSASSQFQGYYDGNGRKVSNLDLDMKGFSYGGLFGYAGNKSVIKNLTVEKFRFGGAGSYYGFIAAYSAGVVENCHSADCSMDLQGVIAGGIVGASENAVRNCSFDGVIAGYGSIGGIAGNCYGEISQCHASGEVVVTGIVNTSDTDAGGIAGEAYSLKTTNCIIKDSYFSGSVVDNYGSAYIAGLVGFGNSMAIERCFTVGSVFSNKKGSNFGAGGLIGFSTSVTASDCYNAGSVVSSNSNQSVGGIVGYLSVTYSMLPVVAVEGASKFIDCYNSGMVKSDFYNINKGLYGGTYSFQGIDPAAEMFVNTYFDNQVNAVKNEKFGRPTSFFASGVVPEGFDNKTWSAEKGFYPVLAGISDNNAAMLGKSTMLFADNENAGKFKTELDLNAGSGVEWKIYDESGYVEETDALKITGSKLVVKDVFANNVVIAKMIGGSSEKMYLLSVVPKVFDGDGTVASPYLIKSKADFIQLHDAVQTHGQPYEGDFFTMTNDIDFDYSDDFQGVGGKGGKNYFEGSFDGKGHYVHKLKIHAATYDDSGKADFSLGAYYYAGLFNVLGKESTVKNLNIADDCDFDFWAESGPVAGYTNGRIENCRNYADVKGVHLSFGGIVGDTDSTAVVSRCYNSGNILSGNKVVGGIAGLNRGIIELCQNDGNVTADVYNKLYSKKEQNIAGGIVGQNYGIIDRSLNNGAVAGYADVGGIGGLHSSSYGYGGKISNSINAGIVSTFVSVPTRGGVVGNIENQAVLENCYYDSSVNVNGAADNSSMAGATGISTSKLVDGKALGDLNREDWLFVSGTYPGLVDFAYEDASVAMRNTYVEFADGEIRTNMVNSVDVAKKSSLKWELKQSKNFQLDGNLLSVTNPTDMSVAVDTLVATYGGKFSKTYLLMAIPQNLFDGKGTEDAPYQLKTIDDMTKLADFIETSKMEYEGYFFKLMNDLDYTDAEYKPIATGNINFQADFDGNGRSISNFKIENAEKGEYLGLFGNIGASGFVHDLTLDGSIVGYRRMGGLVAKLYGKVKNVVNKSTITSNKNGYAGGIVFQTFGNAEIIGCRNVGSVVTKNGYCGGMVYSMAAGGLIEDCSNTGRVATLENKTGYIGGIAYECGGTIRNCFNTSELVGSSTIGGIVAKALKGYNVEDCYNTADITGTGSKIAGIIGNGASRTVSVVKNCYNTGDITGGEDLGGLCGSMDTGVTIENCYNEGKIVSTKASTSNAGGLVGELRGDEDYPGILRNSYNKGEINAIGSYVGGLIGAAADEETTMEDCYNLGNITVVNADASKKVAAVGGVAGDLSGKAYRCWNAGNITSSGYGTGGIGGYSWGTAESCFNLGDVTSTNNTSEYGIVGGIWGYGRSVVRNCYNMGTLTAPMHLGGINGELFYDGVVENCYNAGKIVCEDAATCGNITRTGNVASVTLANNYYDKDVNPTAYDSDKDVKPVGLATQELMNAELGDGFLLARAAYPTLNGIVDNGLGNFRAAYVAFAAEGDGLQNVTDKFYVGMLDNVEWTSSDNVAIDAEGVANTTEVGEAWVKAAMEFAGKTYEKTLTLNIVEATMGGVDTLKSVKTISSRVYYDLSGVEVANPQHGSLYIVKTVYDDGTTTTAKSYYKQH